MSDDHAAPAAPAEEVDPPDGWFIAHHRAFNSSSCYFGPFATYEDAYKWRLNHRVSGSIIPMYLTVNWNR